MAMSHRDRFKLKSQVLEALNSEAWSWQQIELLFGEFGLPSFSDDPNGPDLTEIVSSLSDEPLTELYALVFDVAESEVTDVVESSVGSQNWKSGYARVFLSHSAKYKEFVGEVSDELAVLGIHGFVAHETMEYTKPWQDQIEAALKSMQAFVAIVHPPSAIRKLVGPSGDACLTTPSAWGSTRRASSAATSGRAGRAAQHGMSPTSSTSGPRTCPTWAIQ